MNAPRMIRYLPLAAMICFAASAAAQGTPAYTPPPKPQPQAPAVEKNLKMFDMLDFDVFSNQKWDRFPESHANDIVVTWPDGHETHGLAVHIEDLKAMFAYAPDTRIAVHPIRFGSGDWTSVTGVMTGTFSKPMAIGGGKFIQPTGKSFKLGMATIGHWKNGKMDHEWLYWDNATYVSQLGIGK